MDDQAKQILDGYFSKQKVSNETPISKGQSPFDNQATQILDGYFTKKNSTPNPLDDSYITKAQADTGDQSYNNYCEAFVEQVAYGNHGLYPSAQQAWNEYAKQGKAIHGDVTGAPRGAMIYFRGDNSNFGDGHVGFSDGQGNLISATSLGVKSIPLTDWMAQTHQKPLGYVIPK